MDAHPDVEDAPSAGAILASSTFGAPLAAAGAAPWSRVPIVVVLAPVQLEGKAGPHETLAPLEAALMARAVGRASPQVRARPGPSSAGQD